MGPRRQHRKGRIKQPARPRKSADFRDFPTESFPHGQRITILSNKKKSPLVQGKAMNAPSEMNFEDMLRIRLEVLRREHRDLDEAIHALETAGRPDQLTLRRLKKQKLALKDQIVKLEDQLIPDIIA